MSGYIVTLRTREPSYQSTERARTMHGARQVVRDHIVSEPNWPRASLEAIQTWYGAEELVLPYRDGTLTVAPVRVWYVGPESIVYHTRSECPALRRSNRYYPVDSAYEPPPGRRLCALCAKAGT